MHRDGRVPGGERETVTDLQGRQTFDMFCKRAWDGKIQFQWNELKKGETGGKKTL